MTKVDVTGDIKHLGIVKRMILDQKTVRDVEDRIYQNDGTIRFLVDGRVDDSKLPVNAHVT